MPTTKKYALLDHYQSLLSGLGDPDLLPDDFAIGVAGQRLDKPGLAKALNAKAQPFFALQAAEAALKRAKQAAEKAKADAKTYAEQVDLAMIAYLSPTHPKLPNLDIKPKVAPKPLTTEQVLVRTLKSNETRRLRGTLGPRKKQALRARSVPPTQVVVDDQGLHIVDREPQILSEPSSPEPAS